MADVIEVPYPFVRETVSLPDDDEEGTGSVEVETWRPGTRQEHVGMGDVESYADGIGSMQLTVVSEHKPGRFPTRIFFTRRWVDPDGKQFGKPKLRMTTKAAFQRLAAGYRHHFASAPRPVIRNSPRAQSGDE